MQSRRWPVLVVAVAVMVAPAGVMADDGPVIIEPDDQQDEEQDDEETLDVGEVEVIGERPAELESVPGAASVVDDEELDRRSPASANEVLRTLPGVHVRDEEGTGARPNIGIRGLDPSRSRTLLVLEDGVPISLAPYGEPELYYAPAIERMERMELVKGSGSILFGPQTIGGVLNYVTPGPPEEFSADAELRGGNFGYFHGAGSVGDTVGDFGYRIEAMHQRFAGARNTNMQFTDVTGRMRYEFDDTSHAGLKLHFYDEFSNSTYLGLTTPQFEANRNDNFAVHDELPVQRLAASANYNTLVGDNVLLQTTVYGHRMARPWNRQDFDRADQGHDYERVIAGDGTDITDDPTAWPDDGSAIFLRQTMGERDRTFYIGGVEPRATIDYDIGEVDNELIVGARLHGEMAVEQRVNTRLDDEDFEEIRDDETRRGLAAAGYAQNRFMLMDRRLQISPGLRVESFWSGREIRRTRNEEGVPEDVDPPHHNRDHVLALIPGVGVSYALTDEFTLFSGIHRGFAPPRTKDAVTSDGDLLELDAEFSINYELGIRTRIEDWLAGEFAAFALDFSNQIIPPAEAAGATGADPEEDTLVNAGETLQFGVETDVTFDPGQLADWGFGLPISATYTWVHAQFGDAWEEELVGNRIPYAPEHRLATALGFEHPVGLSAQLSGMYVSEQFTDPDNTDTPSEDGLAGRIDPYMLVDARVGYTHEPIGTTFFVAGKNLTDENYVASRAPRGIQPGAPRHLFVGVRGEM